MSDNTGNKGLPVGVKYSLVSQVRATQTPTASEKPILFNDLYQYVSGHSAMNAQRIEAALKTNPQMKAKYQSLMKSHMRLYGPKLQAASANNLKEFRRHGESFVVHVAPSGVDEQQCYVTLTFDVQQFIQDGDAVMLHVEAGSESRGRLFPPVAAMNTRLIFDVKDDLLTLLQDDDAELYLV